MQHRPELMIPQLGAEPDAPFPAPESALTEPDGLLAWGGDLDPERLARAYRMGLFPWYSEEQPILWWCPSRRAVLLPADVHVSRRLRRRLRQGRYRVTANRDFAAVINACAAPRRGQPDTWITPAMRTAYLSLHALGRAHSVEVWDGEQMVGGLYGIAMGAVMFGESMFSAAPDASKVAMVALCQRMVDHGYALLDCQVLNPHLEAMGATDMSRARFLGLLRKHVDSRVPRFADLFKPDSARDG